MITTLFENTQIYIGQTYAGNKSDVFGEYNMALHVKDNTKKVLNNRSRLLNILSDKHAVCQIVWVNQVHGADVSTAQLGWLKNADSLISDKIGVALAIMTADCVPIALFDDNIDDNQFDNAKIACVHAGTKGLASGVIYQTVKQMTNPTAYIGACISQKNYQLPKSLADNIIAQSLSHAVQLSHDNTTSTNNTLAFYEKLCQTDSDQTVLFDVGGLARLQLQALGVKILNDNVPCSYDDDNFFSHRQATHQNKHTGRMAMIIAKKSKI